MHAARTYYHIESGSSIYPEAMQRHHMVGILWQHLAQYQTWFGPAAYLVHAIQMIPFVPVSEWLLPRAFVAEEHPVLQGSCDAEPRCAEDGWSPFATMARAIVDAKGAWLEARATADRAFSRDSPAGNGNSRLNTLYWIATRAELATLDAEPRAEGEGEGKFAAEQGAADESASAAPLPLEASAAAAAPPAAGFAPGPALLLLGCAALAAALALATRGRALGALLRGRRAGAEGEGAGEALLSEAGLEAARLGAAPVAGGSAGRSARAPSGVASSPLSA